MSYRVLARKYRPQSFDDVIGQSHIATTLQNALTSGKVAHAYLFSGPRGVGKTTTARILAKCLNCEKGPTPTPCNQCDACQRIAQGQELIDVLEIDAASNRGIEEIRELRDNVRYAPAKSRYKVYIVDEAHQITHDAFNAFLKTLEEPPEHAVFVLATTEHQKIPATILSRCQLFRFKRVSEEEIMQRLGVILKQEKLEVEEAALRRLARAAGGSVRDALSLLDQALAYTTGTLTAQQVEMLLGFLPEEFLVGFASALLERKPEGVLQWVRQLADEGWELPQFVRDFREFLRLTMIEQIGAGTAPNQLKVAGRSVSLIEILQMIKVMGQSLEEMRWSDNPQLVLELYALRLTQPFVDAAVLVKRIEDLEKSGVSASSAARPAPAPSYPSPAPRPAAPIPAARPIDFGRPSAPPMSSMPTPAAKPAEPKAEPAPVAPQASGVPISAQDAGALWKKFLAELWKKPAVASHMERAALKSATAREWIVSFADAFAMDSVQRSHAFLQETLDRVAGQRIILRFTHDPKQASAAAQKEEDNEVVVSPAEEAKIAQVSQDASVQKILSMFKGKIRLPDEGE